VGEGTVSATVRVDLKDKSYDIIIGAGVLGEAGTRLAQALPSKKVCVVTDDTVAKTYLLGLMHSLEEAGFTACPPIILPAGEKSKNFQQLQSVVDKALSYRLDRRSTLIALGGGVVGDITGFAASIILRGICFAQIPTTMLAQVDSSVGGKTGVNTAQGKNLAGTFYQPKIVLIDTDTLKTLPARERRAGYAEIVKYGLIDRPEFFAWLEQNGTGVLAGEPASLTRAISESCMAKAETVAADEKEEKGQRELLNLGHTFGHAIEAIGGFDGRILHGEAVSIGMKMAYDFSARLGLCPAADAARVTAHLEKTGLMTAPPFHVSAKDMLEKMRGDKKNRDGKVTLILSRGIGKSFLSRDTEEKALADYLAAAA
jgi:3-dehydroquinate synthase